MANHILNVRTLKQWATESWQINSNYPLLPITFSLYPDEFLWLAEISMALICPLVCLLKAL